MGGTREGQHKHEQLRNMVVAFFSLVRILGECSIIHFSPALFFFLGGGEGVKVEIRSRTLIPLFRLGSVHSGSAS